MRALIDADILRYEIGFSAEPYNEEMGKRFPLSFERCAELLKDKVDLICDEVEADEATLFLTPSGELWRDRIAVTRPYKGNRTSEKPFHWKNLTVHMKNEYDTFEATHDLEADDWICITHRNDPENTIICSRDKDLRMCPGQHYSWECGKQASIGPVEVDDLGWLERREDGKVVGFGNKFFYYQMLAGDPVDAINGLSGYGPVKSFNLVNPLSSVSECYALVRSHYVGKMGVEGFLPYLKEQANLLWMVREMKGDKPVHYRPPVK